MFASCWKPSKSLNRSSKNTTRSARLPQSQSPFSTCANKFDFGRTMCTFPRQAECVWNTLVHAVLLSERQWGQDKLKMALICLLCSRQGFNSFRASARRGQVWKSGLESSLTQFLPRPRFIHTYTNHPWEEFFHMMRKKRYFECP